MKFEREILPGAWVIRPRTHTDHRGQFVKTYARSLHVGQGVSFDFAEEFYSISARHVVRGMHLQVPPHNHVKLVYCVAGVARDVLLDLRKGPGYGRVAEVDLTADEPAVLLIPSGVAHGCAYRQRSLRAAAGMSLLERVCVCAVGTCCRARWCDEGSRCWDLL